MNDRDRKIAWAAGFFDADGCINISRQQGNTYSRLMVILVQKSVKPIEAFAALWPKGWININHRDHASGKRTGYYRFTLSGKNAADALVEMLPHMVDKRDQAVLAVEFQDAFELAKPLYQGKSIPQEMRDYRNKVAEVISDLKRGAGASTESLGALKSRLSDSQSSEEKQLTEG